MDDASFIAICNARNDISLVSTYADEMIDELWISKYPANSEINCRVNGPERFSAVTSEAHTINRGFKTGITKFIIPYCVSCWADNLQIMQGLYNRYP